MLLGMPSSASPGSSGSAGQEPGRPSIPSPTGGKKSNKNDSHREIYKENSISREYVNPPADGGNANLAAARVDVISGVAATSSSNGAALAIRNWADCDEVVNPGTDDDFTVVKTKKRRRESSNSPTAATPSSNSGRARSGRRVQSSARSVPRAQEIPTTRAHIAEARARQTSSAEEHCVYLEHGPELQPFHYLRALDRLLEGTAGVVQVSKVNGHQLLGLANRGLAKRLINNGLEVEGTLLRAFPFLKRSERITVGNLPFFVEDSAIIKALGPYGRITSIAPKMMKAGPYTYTDGRREAFIVLHEGVTTERLPTRLNITIKDEAWPAYLSSGIKCSRCHGQGHRRANCPLLAGRTTAPGPATPTSPTSVPPATAPRLPQQPSAQPPPPASPSPTMEVSDVPPTSRAALHPPAALRQSLPAPSALPAEDAPLAPPPVTPAPSLRTPGSREPAAPTPDVEMSIVEETSASSTSAAKSATRVDLDEFIERHPTAQRKGPLLSPPQCDALAGLIGQILDLRPGAASNLYKVLGQVKAELRTTPAAVPTPPLPVPRPSEPVPLTSHGKQLSPALRTPPLPAPAEMEENVPMTEEERCAPPPPAPRLAGPIPPVPHGDTTTPAMATPPPPLSAQMDRALMDKRWEALRDLMHELDREFELDLEHRFQSRVDVDDIIRAILYPGIGSPSSSAYPLGIATVFYCKYTTCLHSAVRPRVARAPEFFASGGCMSSGTTPSLARAESPSKAEEKPVRLGTKAQPNAEIPAKNALQFNSSMKSTKNQRYVNPATGGKDANPAAPTDFAASSSSEAAAQAHINWAELTEDSNSEYENARRDQGGLPDDQDERSLPGGTGQQRPGRAPRQRGPRGGGNTPQGLPVPQEGGENYSGQPPLLRGGYSRGAESMPERHSSKLQAGEEKSPKIGFKNKNSEESLENQENANSPAGDMHENPAAARGDVTAPKTAATTSATPASPASLNWADSEMAEVDDNEGFIVVKGKKRRRGSTSPEHAARQPNRPGEQRSSQQQKRPTGPRSMPPQEIKATRANIADAKARQTSTNHENYIFVELCPDIPDYSYLRAIGNLVGGPGKISQFNRMNGHYVVGLATKDHASRLVEVGLDIKGTHLKVFPFRKRAERITIANLPGFAEDSAIVEALRNFGTVTSIAPIMIKMGEYTFNDGRREAFILLREGVRLESLPTRLTIKSKGDTLSAFLSFGIKCSKCGKQGHRRANCPSLARQNSSPRQAASPTDARPLPPPPPQQPRRPTPVPATPASPVQPAKTSTEAPAIPSAPHPAEPKDLAQPAPAALPAPMAAPRPLEPAILPLDIEMSEEERTSTPSTPSKGKPAIVQLREHLEKLPSIAIDHSGLCGLDWEDAQKLLASPTNMKKRVPSLLEAQETNAFHLGSGQGLCLGYSAVVLAHPVAISGSGLACVFGPGVAVLQQRILWPGHIALTTIDVRGEEMTAIAVHLAHEPRERNRQLELLAATAAQEEEGACWIIGDFNIRDRGPSSSSSSDALAALLDLAALVDVATQFDAAHLPTRVAMHGDQVESNRLDRILVLAGVLDRVSIYATSHYHLSDHRLVLLQVGPPTTAVSSPTQPRLAAMLRSGLVLEHLAGYIRELEEDTAHDNDDGILWDKWTTIKAGLLAEARSLHDPRHAASDSYIYRARRYIAAQLEASSIRADYPSLPDLSRAIRLRRPVSVIRDEQDNIIEGPELRRRAFATFQPRFARPTSDPAAGAAFIASSAPTTTTRELSEEDPLHRPDISPSEIAHAIEHLPRGKAPGWDGLPCELLVAFNEDFFAEALARVFAASRLRGALPPSTRRSSICLVPKARGGRGLDGYRPVALPSADYRVLAAILHRRHKPHLRTLVPECQTYAVPGRSPSWNIAMVTDAIEEATALGSPLAVMGVDLESAFDSLDRGFLESLLTSLRLPPAFMAWINILYAGADATIRAGGFHTTAFPLLNGLRQGCAVSAALFSIATGPLLRRLELTLGVGNVIAYADDIVLLFHRDGDFERVATVFEEYKQASGVGVNLRKSAGLWCGAWRNRGDSPLGASWSTTSIRILGLDIAPRSTVAHREQHLLALLENACRKWTPFTRGLSLVGRARAANTLVGSVIQHHLHGYLPSPPTIAKLQARLARFVWGQDHTAWLPADVMARPVAIGGLGLLDLATQLQLACLKGVQVALRGGRNAFSWLVESGEAWIHPPPDGTRLQPRRLRLLKLWEEASNILSLNHRALPTAQLLDLPIIGGCRFLRPPDLLAPARWSGSRVRDLIEEENLIARPTRSVLADATALGAFCRRLTSENAVGFGAESTPSSSSLAAAVVLRGTATPFLNGLTTRSARRALDRPRLAATPISRFLARWTPTINPPSRIDWASLRRCAYSGHEADAALKLALHALPHPAHPASVGPSCPACGSIDRSLGHRYWCCRSIRPLIREAFNIIGRPPDLQAWIFGGSGLEDDALSILASAKLRIYRYFVQVGLGEAVEDPLIAWSRTLQRRGGAESMPERHSSKLQAGEEKSPKIGFKNKNSEESLENQENANSPAGDMHKNPAAARGDVTAPKTAATTSATPASPASLNWADSEMAEVDDNEGFIVVKGKKRRRGSTSPEHAARQPNRPGEQRSSQQQKRPTGPRSMPPQEIKATRANIADAKARQTSTNHENYIFVELCPDIPDYSYLREIGNLVGGPGRISQFNRMNGHYVVGLATKDHASRLVEVGLDIKGTHLKVFPFRKRAERITIANLPGFAEDSAIVEALRNFGTVTSIAPIMIKMGEYTFNDGRREAFILLREGVRLESLPTRLTIKSKGDTLSAFLSFGIKCSKCGKQGHRRANCPSLARQNSSPRQAASPTDARPLPPPPPQQPRRPTPAPATPASPVQPAKTSTEAPAIPSAPHPAEPKDLAQPAPAALPAPMAAPRPLEPAILPLDIEMSEEERTSTPSTPSKGKPAIVQLREHLEKLPSIAIDHSGLCGLDWEDAQKLLASPTNMKKRVPSLLEAQETNAFHLGSGQGLCLGYSAVVLAHPVAISGSGLACVFGPGVAVLQQRILWPGHIALTTIDVRGEEMTAIAVHLAHEPRERNRQLELLAATAAQEEEGACWIIGDFNIRDRGPSSSSSSDALAALLDLAALVDVATQFDAAHLPTRVAMHGDQVESNRLDRILVPAGVLDRVSIYATSHYHLSDHRLVLLQVGPPTTAVSSPTQPRLAAMLRSGLVLEHLAGYIRELEEDTAHDNDDGILWDKWTTIKAGLLAKARSLHDPRHAASDSYIYRARRYIAAQLEASSIRADYPSLPDLSRAIRLRRPVSVIRDEQDNIIEGPELRRRAFATFQPRFARPTSDPAAGAAFIASSAPTTTRELSEEDPLHRPDISPSEIANAIEHLPRGKAPGWDGLPCELLVASSEDFFAEALARVFAASRLRGALPPSTRRSSICLVPKARGGRGLDGYRPVALPSADYRVVGAILHRRLKPHLRTLVPECQTYAVPGRIQAGLRSWREPPEERWPLVRRLAQPRRLPSRRLLVDHLHQDPRARHRPQEHRRPPGAASTGPPGDYVPQMDALHPRPLPRRTSKAANTLVGSTIQHHLHGYLPSPPTIAKLQARLARFVWGPDHTAWLPANVMARSVAIGDLGLLDLATQLQLACLKGVQVALRGGRNAFSWLVGGNSGEAWIHPPPDGTRLQPRRLRLLKLWEEASNILGLNHQAIPTAQLLDLPIIGGCRFLRPPDLLAPARWSGARFRSLIEEEHLIARPTRSALADAATLGAFCRRLTLENAVGFGAESTPSSSSLAAAVVLRGTTTPFLNGLTTRSARRALDRPRLAATPISRFTSRWSPTIGPPPSRIDWASLRRCAYSGHEADAALKLAFHALPHPAHPASVDPSFPACGSIDRSLSHRYWCCPSIRPLIREAFNIIGRPPDLQAWIFGGSGLEDDALSILASAKLRIYRYFVQMTINAFQLSIVTHTLERAATLSRAPPFSPLECVSLALTLPNSVSKDSPQSADQEPERPSTGSQPGEEFSPKNENMMKISKEIYSETQKDANLPAGDMHVNLAAARGDVTAPKTAATTSATPASPASLNWADSEMAEVDSNDGYTIVKSKKRRLTSTPEHAARQPGRPAEKPSPQQRKRPTGPRAVPPQEIKATRANIADARARQATTNHENYVFVELCPEIPDYSYLKAMSALLGGAKKHYAIQPNERPLHRGPREQGPREPSGRERPRNRGNDSQGLPLPQEGGAHSRGQPARLCGGPHHRDRPGPIWEGHLHRPHPGQNGGVHLHRRPPGGVHPAPRGRKAGDAAHPTDHPLQGRHPVGLPLLWNQVFQMRPPPPPQQPRKPAPAPATPASPVHPAKTSTEAPVTPSAPHPAEPGDLAQPAPVALPAPLATPRPLEPDTFPLDIEMSKEELTTTPSASPRGKPALFQLLEHLKQSPNLSIDWDKLPGIDREDAQQLLTSKRKMEKRVPSLTKAQVAALDQVAETIKASIPDSNHTIRKTLPKTKGCLRVGNNELPSRQHQRARAPHSGEEPCPLSSPQATSRGHRVCPGDKRISSRQRPRPLPRLQRCYIGPSRSHLGIRTRLRLRTRQRRATTACPVAGPHCLGRHRCPRRGDDHHQRPSGTRPPRAARAIGAPGGNSDPGEGLDPRGSQHQGAFVVLRGCPRRSSGPGCAGGRSHPAEARSLHDPRHAASDGYVVRARRYIAAQLEASSIRADYPSLPDLARAIHLRRPVSVIRDDDDNVIEGPELRTKAYAIFQPRFARPTSDPAAGAAFIGNSMIIPISALGEEDPLHRPEICPSEIAAAIRHLPRGKAPVWDGLPCELLAAFEDFFAEALAQVFAASRLRGALPPSTRRSSICLVPKARGGRGLEGYRPIALPSADYRVLAAILHRRLKPHLRALVPDCQTYAVPGRSPSWNIAKVTDAVEEATAMGSPLAVMGIDLESAFDSLDRGFLESLMSLRLPPAFMGWINILYAGADATIRAGGFHPTAFPLLNGLRQGCAVSVALFSIATGPLLRRLELTLGVGNVIAYADDIVLLFHRDEEFERAATVLEDFKRASGIAVNLGKSAGLWCGAWRNRGDSPFGASWSTTSIRVLGLDIAPRSSVAHQEQHLLALLESACRRWTPFTRGLSLVGRARAANSLVGSTIQHHLHGYLPSPPTIAKLQARLARFVWGPEHTAWLPAAVMARPVAIGGLGLLDLATQLQLACLKGVQVALRGGRNGFDWLVASSSEAWIRPPPDGMRLQPRRLRLLKLWEEASKILSLNHRAVPTSQLLDIPIIGGCRFLRPPDLLAPARWRGARVRDLLAEDHLIARPTRSVLADAATLGAFYRRLTSENAVGFGAESTPSSSSLAAAVVLRGTATPFLNGLTTRSARRALDRPRLAATPISRFTSRWSPTIGPPPSRIDWASLRRCAYSGHEADAVLKLALHALRHPAHPASVGPSCPACGSIDRSLSHRYWCCQSIRPLIREAFNIIGRPPDLQAWIFGGSGLEDDALSILASAKLRVYRYFVQ
ncbi:hypothetical protein LAZ67_2003691, partial [Cordylochernes scorpioides]